jgi:hypothetical protein
MMVSWVGLLKKLLKQDVGAELVVMGHTKKPIFGIANSPLKYTNTVFNCHSNVVLGNKNATFVQIDIEACQAELLQVIKENGSYNIKSCPAQPIDNTTPLKLGEYTFKLDIDHNTTLDQIIKLSTYDKKYIIEVVNKTQYELQCVGVKNDSGTWTLQNIFWEHPNFARRQEKGEFIRELASRIKRQLCGCCNNGDRL